MFPHPNQKPPSSNGPTAETQWSSPAAAGNPKSQICNRPPYNNASPGESFVTPPRRNSDNFASPPHANREPANDLQQPGEAKFAA
jgi:hypothetical protein